MSMLRMEKAKLRSIPSLLNVRHARAEAHAMSLFSGWHLVLIEQPPRVRPTFSLAVAQDPLGVPMSAENSSVPLTPVEIEVELLNFQQVVRCLAK